MCVAWCVVAVAVNPNPSAGTTGVARGSPNPVSQPRGELQSGPAVSDAVINQAFSQMDANSDGVVTRQEFAAAAAAGTVVPAAANAAVAAVAPAAQGSPAWPMSAEQIAKVVSENHSQMVDVFGEFDDLEATPHLAYPNPNPAPSWWRNACGMDVWVLDRMLIR